MLILAIGFIMIFSGCNNSSDNPAEKTKEHIGYITFYDGDKLELLDK